MNKHLKKIIIAIDGFSSSGKSTMARNLARWIGYIYVDSGAMYRAVTQYALENGLVSDDNTLDIAGLIKALPDIHISFAVAGDDGRQHTLLNGRDVEAGIRDMRVSSLVSRVAEIPEVRKRLTALQKEYGKDKGIVMDGRDIGTTVFPEAEMKIFVNASPEERARRRMAELHQKGEDVTYEEVLKNVMERDHIDTTRKESPLRKAEDAIEINNDSITIDQQNRLLIDIYNDIAAE